MATAEHPDRKSPVAPNGKGELPPPTRNGWVYVFTAFGILTIAVLVLTAVYRQSPRRTGIVERRSVPAVQGVYTVVLSPTDSVSARLYADAIVRSIGKDSSITKMVIGSSLLAKQCTSLEDYRQRLYDALVFPRLGDLRAQSIILSDVAGIAVSDQLPSTMYLVGSIGTTDYSIVESRFGDVVDALQIRNQTIGPLRIVSFLPPHIAASGSVQTTHAMFLNSFRERGLDVIEQDTATVRQ